MKNIIILILCSYFLFSCQGNKRENLEKSTSLPKIETEKEKELISPKYEIYNAVIKKMRWSQDTIFIYSYNFIKNKRKDEKYSSIDTTILSKIRRRKRNKVFIGKDIYTNFITQIDTNHPFNKNLIKGSSIIVNDSSYKKELLTSDRYKKTYYNSLVMYFSPIGFNKSETKAFVVIEMFIGGSASERYFLFEKINGEWEILLSYEADLGIYCW